jgi:threonine dehydrogenase-like Zn-dependent dehydrogenase
LLQAVEDELARMGTPTPARPAAAQRRKGAARDAAIDTTGAHAPSPTGEALGAGDLILRALDDLHEADTAALVNWVGAHQPQWLTRVARPGHAIRAGLARLKKRGRVLSVGKGKYARR